MYEAGDKKEAFERLRMFSKSIHDDANLLARCHLALGQWESELNDTLSEVTVHY